MQAVEASFSAVFTPARNPFYHLGALTIFFFWVVLVSGLYVFVMFKTSVFGAYPSVEYLTHQQWYLGGVMRSLHRYASDAAIVTILLHMLREFSGDRYRGPRWFSWFTGIPLLWLVFPLGITGYWLVWDQLAQYLAIASSELLDALPIFTDPMARNFLTPDSLSDRFFTLLAFLHLIGLPIFLVFGIWFHLLRVSRPTVNPPRALMFGSLLMLFAVALFKPALSQGPADLNIVPATVGLDWFYLPVYPLLDYGSPNLVWALLVGSSLFFAMMPWLPYRKRAPVAVVDLDNCNGCGRCVDDCPYNAVTLMPRSDGLSFSHEVVVNTDLCVSCGICAGACPTATPYRRKSELQPGIELPDYTIASLRDRTIQAAAALHGSARVIVYGCDAGPDLEALCDNGVAVVRMPCVAMLPPSFIDFVLSRQHVEAVLLTGCREHDCHFRFGVEWMEQRLNGQRDPYLRSRVPRERIAQCWAGSGSTEEARRALTKLRERVVSLPLHARGATLKVVGQTHD
jgi:ferredoxin